MTICGRAELAVFARNKSLLCVLIGRRHFSPFLQGCVPIVLRRLTESGYKNKKRNEEDSRSAM